MIKIVTIIGARPQIIKAAALSRAINNQFSDKISEIIVHTGQHYDENMSNVFFNELGIPKPTYNLSVGSGSHGKQTGLMIEKIEEILLQENPNYIVLYGDTNSTLAGAIAASKIHIPIVHIEAGLRSYNKRMPEEINRIMCDHVSTLLFSPTKTGFSNLLKEGFRAAAEGPFHKDNPCIYHCGDVMYDNSLYFSTMADQKSTVLKEHKLTANKYLLATIHRDNNTDVAERLSAIFSGLNTIATAHQIDVIIPLHPRTKKLLPTNLLPSVYNLVQENKRIKLIEPVSFLDMIMLEKNALLIATDSGGVQKESFFFKKPCIIMRPETEWIELVENKNATIVDADEQKIIDAFVFYKNNSTLSYPPMYGDGHAAAFICEEMIKNG